jgi:hypothetical protein
MVEKLGGIRGLRVFDPALVRKRMDDETTMTKPIRVTEKVIAEFCSSCEMLLSNNICDLLGSEVQAVNSLKGSCYSASKNEIRGRVINGVFLAGRRRTTPRSTASLSLVK